MRALLLALFLAASGSAMGASYDVKGVEWGDVLNIRKSPSAKSAMVGAIPYDGQGVDVTGKPVKGWVPVLYRDTKGFVLAKYLTPSQVQSGLPATLKCHGTEPFWNAEFGPKGSTYEHMSDGKTKVDIGPFEQTANRSDSWMAMGPKSAASLTRNGRCSNGMSDETFPFTLHMSTPASGIVSGCCK
jgi:uncharacterized membrane protein